MSDFWLNIIGLTISSGFIVYLFGRFAKAARTGRFHYGAGRYLGRDDEPRAFMYRMAWQLVGTAFWVWLYGMLLYNKFITDTDWMSR